MRDVLREAFEQQEGGPLGTTLLRAEAAAWAVVRGYPHDGTKWTDELKRDWEEFLDLGTELSNLVGRRLGPLRDEDDPYPDLGHGGGHPLYWADGYRGDFYLIRKFILGWPPVVYWPDHHGKHAGQRRDENGELV